MDVRGMGGVGGGLRIPGGGLRMTFTKKMDVISRDGAYGAAGLRGYETGTIIKTTTQKTEGRHWPRSRGRASHVSHPRCVVIVVCC